MAWNSNATTTDEKTEKEFLKFPELRDRGETAEIRVRILDEEPASVWQHWLGKRPFNCIGTLTCPVCAARRLARSEGRDVREEFPNNWRGFFNVFLKETGEVKVYGFGTGMEKTLKSFYDKYGDMRNYDITIQKRKTGPHQMNVEYQVFYEGPSELSSAEQTASESQRHDLSQYVAPASMEDLLQVAKGTEPVKAETPSSNPLDEFKPAQRDDALWDRFLAAAKKKEYDATSFGFTKESRPADDVFESLVAALEA